MKRIAVLMTCYNRCETTLRCLRTLFAQEGLDDCQLDAWLVDDASPDKTGERVKAAYPQVHVIYSKGNLFWCKGMRLAWEMAVASGVDYDFYLWLNDDVMLNRNAISSAIGDSNRHDNKAIVCGTLTEDGTAGALVTYGLSSAGAMNGNFVLVPRSAFQKVGYVYGGYHHAFGDYDYGFQAVKKGFSIVPSGKVAGACKREPQRYSHFGTKNLLERLLLLNDAKGYNLHDGVVYKYRKAGLGGAILSFFHIIWIVARGK